jgi:cytochrome P450 family 27 subfamily C
VESSTEAVAKLGFGREGDKAAEACVGMCTQVIRESMRMFPVGGSGIGRYADRDVELGGYLIPKGTEVAVCLYTMHRVPWNFPDPDSFKPDRWLTTVEDGARTSF